MNYNTFIISLREILQEEQSPLRLHDGKWEVASPKELLLEFNTRIFDSHLSALEKIAINILSEIDPQFDLPSEQRYASSVHGKTLNYSVELREGISKSIALIGNYGSHLKNCSQGKPKNTARNVIQELLSDEDWKLWGSLNSLLPNLAESAPNTFLNIVESTLRKPINPYVELFKEESSGFGGRNYMTGILWALESLAWREVYLSRVILILAELAKIDPGGNWTNRPINSITSILLPWYPQTQASIDKRINSIKGIKNEFPDITWNVLMSLLPRQHQTSSGTYKPKWHFDISENWKPEVNRKDYWKQIESYSELAINMAKDNLDKLSELVDNLDNLPVESIYEVIDYLSSNSFIEKSEEERLEVWNSLVDCVNKHRRYSEAEWALDSDIVSELEIVANKIKPKDPSFLYQRLFTDKEYELYEENEDWQQQSEKLLEKRISALNDVMKSRGLNGIISLLDNVKSTNKVGYVLSQISSEEIEDNLFPNYLTTNQTKYNQFVQGYVNGRCDLKGWGWVQNLNNDNWSLHQKCELLTYLPFKNETWQIVKDWLGENENRYWESVSVNPWRAIDDNLSYSVDKLLDNHRPHAALSCLYVQYHEEELDTQRTTKALLDAIKINDSEYIDSYQITELIKALQEDQKVTKDKLIKIEFAYLKILTGYQKTETLFIEKQLANDPDFFCEIIQLLYKSDKDDNSTRKVTDNQKAIAKNAWELLYNWTWPPGLQDNKSFSGEVFRNWLDDVKEKCKESGHLDVALIKIGEVLFYTPKDPDGLWINKVVAKELNHSESEKLRRGYNTEVYNSRGAHFVDPTGKPEQELAEKWRKKADELEDRGYIRFSTSLREIANSYDKEAERIRNDQS